MCSDFKQGGAHKFLCSLENSSAQFGNKYVKIFVSEYALLVISPHEQLSILSNSDTFKFPCGISDSFVQDRPPWRSSTPSSWMKWTWRWTACAWQWRRRDGQGVDDLATKGRPSAFRQRGDVEVGR
jgi:hypothetical protein